MATSVVVDTRGPALDQILRAFASAFDNQEIAANFASEISDMAKTTGEIKQRFEAVSRELHEFDQKGYKKKDGSDVGTLRPTWEGYYADYKSLLAISRRDARELKIVCDDYIDIVFEAIKDKSVDATELRTIAENYKGRTTPKERASSYYADAFGQLSRDLKDFALTIADALHDTKEAFDDQILTLEERIAQLQEVIRKYWDAESIFVKLATVTLAESLEMGIGVASLFPAVAPITLAGVAGLVLAGCAVDVVQNTLRIKTLQTQLTDLKSQKGEFTVLETRLDVCMENINSVAMTVGAFGEFWNAVNLDAQILLSKLDAIMENDKQSLWELRRRLSARSGVGDIYIALRKALLLYAFAAI